MLKNFATSSFTNPFILTAELTLGLRNLSRGWRHTKLRNRVRFSLPCCTENGWARLSFMASSKAILVILLVAALPKFPLYQQTVTDKFFFKTVGQHWFPNKSRIDQFLYI